MDNPAYLKRDEDDRHEAASVMDEDDKHKASKVMDEDDRHEAASVIDEDDRHKAANVMTNWSKSRLQTTLSGISNTISVNTEFKEQLLYSVNDVPPWYLCLILGFQHFLMSFSGVLSMPLLLAPYLCIKDGVAIGELLNTGLFVNGIVTLMQVVFGVRLPIIQGGTTAFLIAAFSILSLPQWKCSDIEVFNSTNDTSSEVTTASFIINQNLNNDWKRGMREIQGAIIVSSLLEVVIGLTGLMGLLLKFIGPLVIAPIIALIGIALFEAAAIFCSANWLVAILTIVLIILFSQYLRNVNIPCCSYARGSGCSCVGNPCFKLFPIIIAILMAWAICVILTISGAFSKDPSQWTYKARTDTRINILYRAQWFKIPYPGQWGLPTVSTAGVLGMFSGVLVGMAESIGDYYACARLSGAPKPPTHAINRGIFIEGIGCVLSGLCGTGTGSTSYSQNVAAIGITKVGSTRVVVYSGFMMIILGTFGKFGALFVTIPDPIIGGVFMSLFGMISAVGISNLQFTDMNSSRNLFIFGFALFIGISVPQWMQRNPGSIGTGYETLNQLFQVLLSTNMFVGGVTAFILDNTVPGTDRERGIHIWLKSAENVDTDTISCMNCYDIPFITPFLRRCTWTKYIPISPTFTGFKVWKRTNNENNNNSEFSNRISVTSLERATHSDNTATQTV